MSRPSSDLFFELTEALQATEGYARAARHKDPEPKANDDLDKTAKQLNRDGTRFRRLRKTPTQWGTSHDKAREEHVADVL